MASPKSPWNDKHPKGMRKMKWVTETHVFMSGYQCHCVCVSPEFPIPACSFLIVPTDTYIARALTIDDIKNPQPKCRVYFTTCEICPKICREEWVYDNVSLNGNLVCLPEGDCPQKVIKGFLKAAGNIDLLNPSITF